MPSVRGLTRLRPQRASTGPRAVLLVASGLVVLSTAVAVWVGPAAGILLVPAALIVPLLLARVELLLAALVAVITLLPFGAVPLGLGFNPTFLDLALLGLYAVTAIQLAIRARPARLRLPNRWPAAIFVGLLIVALLAGLAQGLPAKNQLRTFGELVLAAGLFFLLDLLLPARRGLRRLYWLLVTLGAVAAAMGIALYLLPQGLQIRLLSMLRWVAYPSGPGVLRFINDDPSRLQRATGTAIDPNSFGGLLAVVIALLLPQLVSSRPFVPRWLGWSTASVMVGALLATVSRGSLLGMLAGAGLVTALRRPRWLAAVAVLATSALFAARLIPWSASYLQHFAAGLAFADRATQMRIGEYRDALTLIQRYPWLGVGFGDVRDVDLYRGVSSLYLIVAESMGLVGLGGFLTLVAAVLWRAARSWRLSQNEEVGDMLLGCQAALAAVLVSGVFDHYFFTYPHAFALLWLLIGMAMALAYLAADRTGDTERSRVCP